MTPVLPAVASARHPVVSGLTELRAGLDIGGTKTLGVIVDANGAVIASRRIQTAHGESGVLDSATRVLELLAEDCEVSLSDLKSIGVGIPGSVDPASGTVRQALNLGLEAMALGPNLEALIGRRVHVENDVNCAALGVLERPGSSVSFLNLGTGLAVGLILDGRIWRGARGAAGEIGHIPIDPEGPECPCGQRGCLEVLASGSGLRRQWAADSVPTAAEIVRLIEGGDAKASLIMERLEWAVASAVRLIALSYDVERIVIGGGLAAAFGARLIEGTVAKLRDWEQHSQFLKSLGVVDRVDVVPDGLPVAAIGAAITTDQWAGRAHNLKP